MKFTQGVRESVNMKTYWGSTFTMYSYRMEVINKFDDNDQHDDQL